MKRTAIAQLTAWKNSQNRKPLVIRGARQVGKTWLMKEFGKLEFKNFVYINFDRNPDMANLFEGSLEIPRLISGLQIYCGQKITSDTLLIFDEIQEVPRALSSLKYFCEEAPEYAVIAAGSLLGVAMHQGTSFPVGKVNFMDLYPLSFTEFLNATGNENLVDLLQSGDWQLITTFKNKYIELLRYYYFIGGMPEAVQTFIDENDFNAVRKVQQNILTAYEQDFSKHAPVETVPRIRMVWQSIPSQLAKENRRFVYGALRKGARAKDFELAIQWLKDCGLIQQVIRLSKPSLPLPAYADEGFKMFLSDVGLLGAMSGLDAATLLHGNAFFNEFKGALTEQYVAQELRCSLGQTPCYWSAERATAEVDFVFQYKSGIYPLEVKAEENLKAKSLKVYSEKYTPAISIRSSMSDYRHDDWLLNLPLYGISQILQELDSIL
ncbi:MAG: ATP-binding protein [Lentisphaeria bacterium]|nr:ATP-binding protein [Lentisphaeria bacterium]MBR7143541.1 ATP-binding protein [Lentisphaeria bacterium]